MLPIVVLVHDARECGGGVIGVNWAGPFLWPFSFLAFFPIAEPSHIRPESNIAIRT